jgi:2-polyprenyl-3-methyl-5-hydroxy-6-metoxy-1,4-benzoquinol methylase
MNKVFNPSYIGARPEIQALVPEGIGSVLDVGCSSGNLGAAVKSRTGATVVGIEQSEEMGQAAKQMLDIVYIGDAEYLLASGLENKKFDVIIFADILEHLVDPWGALTNSLTLLNHDGYIIASLPNVRHISTLYQLIIKGYWPYNERGIHDKTHLRFFTKRNVMEMFDNDKLEIDVIEATYRVIDKPYYINHYSRRLSISWLKNIFAFQYLVRAKKR